jgi:predicted metal-dependent hydrolase
VELALDWVTLESKTMPLGPTAQPSSQLSLFDDAAPPAQMPLTVPLAVPPPVPAPPPQPAPGGVFRHPRSQRDIRFGEHLVVYELRRARRRSIGFVVGADGLTVSAPRWVGVGDVEAALREKSAWILRKLHEQRERSRRLAEARVDWRDGTTLPFLGAPVVLRLDPQATGAVLHAESRALHLGLPQGATPAQIRDAVQSWLQRQARRVFEERCQLFAPRLGVRMTRLSLSSAATRWGSASADGSIRLNWRLVHFALPVVDYVVTHELAHLREMNHSAAFWDVVRSVLPEFEQVRGALRHEVLPVFD